MEQIKTSIKYKPLYDFLFWQEALKNKDKLSKDKLNYYKKLSKVDTCIITGGRFSAKSYEVGDWSTEAVVQHDYKILYTRFTNVSMGDSIIPEIQEKIEDNSLQDYFHFANNKYYSLCGDGLISFKGMKTGSNGQTANLKSLKGFNVMVTDEAEEIPDYKTLEKVHLSIRHDTKPNISVLLLNPATTDHFIFKHYFEEPNVPQGFNGIKDNVLYIHTSYLDVDPKVVPQKIFNAFNQMKERRPREYNEIVMGGWVTELEGQLFKKTEIDFFSLKDFNQDNVESRVAFCDPADRGTDSLSMPIGSIIGDKIYITDWYFSQANSEVTIPEISFVQRQNNIETVAIEINGVGGGYAEKLSNVLGCQLIPISAQSNKHSRIISNSGFVRLYFVFRDDYEPDSMYDKAMRELFAYNKDDKENRKQTKYNDDSPDSITGLWLVANDLNQGKWL